MGGLVVNMSLCELVCEWPLGTVGCFAEGSCLRTYWKAPGSVGRDLRLRPGLPKSFPNLTPLLCDMLYFQPCELFACLFVCFESFLLCSLG